MLNLDKKLKYLLACSFGPDSMALFDMLLKEGFDFEVAHVNYNLREESKFEEESLKQYCLLKNIPLHIHVVTKGLKKGNIEAKCREIRYNFFNDLTLKNKYDALLVAHHQDDLIETFIMQVKRKNFVSYWGLPYSRKLLDMNVVRPLLSFTKNDILKYCHENNVPYSIDKTNALDIYERNKIRHEIVEKLTVEERENYLKEIDKNNKNNGELHAFLKKIDTHSVKEVTKLDDVAFAFLLYDDLNNLTSHKDPKISISFEFVKQIKKALLSDNPNIKIKLNDNLSYVKAYDKCYFSCEKELTPYSYVLEAPGKLDTPYFYLDFTNGAQNRNIAPEDYPLTIRNADKKDQFIINDYSVSVRRAFIDWKMPKEIRAFWPVIVNCRGIVKYVPRYKKDFIITSDINFYAKIQ